MNDVLRDERMSYQSNFAQWTIMTMQSTLARVVAVATCLLLTSCAHHGYDPMKQRASEFSRLGKRDLLHVIETSQDPSEILAARVRLNQTGWGSAFQSADTGQSDLGTVLGAVALVKSPQPDLYTVVAACHRYIRQGDVAKIPELISLLVRFGDKPLAEDYLNCGQSDLRGAGVEWANNHGFNVRNGFGSHRVRWGQDR